MSNFNLFSHLLLFLVEIARKRPYVTNIANFDQIPSKLAWTPTIGVCVAHKSLGSNGVDQKNHVWKGGPQTRLEASTLKHLRFETILESTQTFCIASHDHNNHTYQMVFTTNIFFILFHFTLKRPVIDPWRSTPRHSPHKGYKLVATTLFRLGWTYLTLYNIMGPRSTS